VKLSVVVSPDVAREMARRAQSAGIPASRYGGQILEVFLATERCSHGARPPEAPAPEQDQGEADA
jgi:hypothetical protein